MITIPSEWLEPGASVPVTPEVVRDLLECVRVAYKAGQEAEQKDCLDWCAAYASDDGTAQRIMAAIRAGGKA